MSHTYDSQMTCPDYGVAASGAVGYARRPS